MTSIKPNARRLFIFYSLILCIFASSSACYSADRESDKMPSGETNVQSAKNADGNISSSGNAENANSKVSASGVEGWYQFKNYRAGKGGTLNLLIIKKLKNGNLDVYFEGTYVYQANGAETFHESEAAGEFKLKGNIWRGNLSEEEGDQTGCLAALSFSAGKVTLKTSECRLRVSPDGIYKNIPPQEEGETSAQTNSENSAENTDAVEKSTDDQAARLEYEGKSPAAIVNLMAHEGEREGCEKDVLGFYGKVLKVSSEGDYDFEITLADDSGKRQKFSLILVAEDKLPFKETRQIIKTGNYLEIAYLNCGNAPIASPTEIYLR